MSIQSDLDIIYKRIGKQHAADHAKREAIEAPIRKRRAILEAINNYPNSYHVQSAFEGFCMCFPKFRAHAFLRLKERVIVKRVS